MPPPIVDLTKEVVDLTHQDDDNENGDKEFDNENGDKEFELLVQGNPRPLPRMRHARKGGMWNPAKKELKAFKDKAKAALPAGVSILYPKDASLKLTITFYMMRPASHFVGGSRTNPIRKTATKANPPLRPDVDNLAKFVLDALEGVVYSDDGQIKTLSATKVRDNYGQCTGRTHVFVTQVD